MKQIIFLAPSLSQAQSVVTESGALGVEQTDIHAIVSDPQILENTPILQASEVETTELETDLDWGMVTGGTLGLVAGLSVLGAPAVVLTGSTVVLLSSLAGIGLGGWLGAMIGEQTPRGILDKYRQAIAQGHLLLLIEVPDERLPQAFRLIRQHCPQALVEVTTHSFDRQLAA
ncbi:MAG: hypothetical protein OIF57_01970 [Marinobacterium sp.]|nr:hypothetical protein [Marinobacterium sp.]